MTENDLTKIFEGATKEQIDYVLSLNSSDIAAATAKIEAERDNYKSQLETAQTALKEFEGVDVTELNGKIEKLTNDLKEKDKEYKAKIADMEFDSVIDKALTSAGARNTKAAKALLEIETLKASKNQAEDIKKAVAAVKAENDYLFAGENEPFVPINPPGGIDTGKKMSLTEAMVYANKHPGIDVSTLM